MAELPSATEDVQQQLTSLAQLYRANMAETTRLIEAMTKRVEQGYAGLDELLVKVRATLDVLEQLGTQLAAMIDKLMTTTAALVQVQNRLIALMSES